MKTISLKGALGKSFLGFSLLFGIGVMSSSVAQAQWQDNNRDRYDNRGYQNNDSYGQRDNDRDRDRNRRSRWRARNSRYNDGYGDYGGSFDLRQTALNAGFNEGTKAGREDGNKRRRYDFSSHSDYQKGTKDYSSRLGDKYIYQRYFREAYEHGYADGYAGY